MNDNNNSSNNNTIVETMAGLITISQTSPDSIEINLYSSPGHPGNVSVNVTNGTTHDSVKLAWIK